MDATTITRPTGLPRPAHAVVELAIVVGLLEAELWSLRSTGPAWLNALLYLVIGLVGWHSLRRRVAAGFVVTFPKVNGLRAWVEVVAAGVILSVILAVAARMVGDSNETFEFVFLDKPPIALARWLLGKFAAALGQQVALQWFLWPACYEITRGRASGAVLAAAIFGLIHLPSPTLVAITFLAGLVWVAFYQRTGRLAPLVLCHMILATLAHGALPERLTFDMRVGSSALADRKRFDELNDPRIRRINRRLKDNRAHLKLYTSADYYRAQGETLPGLIQGLFRDILDRPATDQDVAFWTSRPLANPRVDIPSILLASDEYEAVLQARKGRRDGEEIRR